MKISRKGIETAYRLIPLWFITAIIVGAIGIAAAASVLFSLSGSSGATATTTLSSPTFIGPTTISVPAGGVAGSCSTTASSFACSGTSIAAGGSYNITATVNNPNAAALSYSLSSQDTGAGWSSACSGPSQLSTGNNTIRCVVASSQPTADTFSVSVTG